MCKVKAGFVTAIALCFLIASVELANAQWTEQCVISQTEVHDAKVCRCPPGTSKVRNPQNDLSNFQNTKGTRSYNCVRTAKPFWDALIFFDFGQDELTEGAAQIVDAIVQMAKSKNATKIEVIGHTDTALVASLSQELSVARAVAVKAALVAKGLPASAITTRGEGKSRPLVPTGDGKKEPQNRRVEIRLYN